MDLSRCLIGEANFLILDLNPDSLITGSLQKILQTCQKARVHTLTLHHENSTVDTLLRQCRKAIDQFSPDVIFIVPSLTKQDDLFQITDTISGEYSRLPIIMVVPDAGNFHDTVNLIKTGVTDFITTPLINTNDVLLRIYKHVRTKHHDEVSFQMLKERVGLKLLVGRSGIFLKEVEKIPAITRCGASATVLISGETGTGKEMFARAIHYLGPRSGQPFVPVNCGAIPVDLLERELFGHVKGAYTSADSSEPGLIKEAEGGTLFLDEIDCLSSGCQVKLLRFLQDRVYRPLGSPKTYQADVHITAATNIDLDDAVEKGTFRSDLFYRLNLIPITLPPLCKRKEDILLLADHFIDRYGSEYDKKIDGMSLDALEKLVLYPWPGNVRELEHTIARAIILSDATILTKNCIQLPVRKSSEFNESFQTMKKRRIAQFEKDYIESLLLIHAGNISKAARSAQTNRRQFFELIRKHDIAAQKYRNPQPSLR